MNIKLGILNINSVTEHLELLAQPVNDAILKTPEVDKVGVVEIDPNLSDTAGFCDHYKISLNQAANCIVLEAKRGGKSWLAACVVLANTRADVNGLARRTLDAKKVSFALMDRAIAETKMEYGAITPVGLPVDWPILIDKAAADAEYVIIGSGIRKSKLVVPGSFLAALPNTQVLENLGRQ